MDSLKRTILDALFPPRCVGCGKTGDLICPKCSADLPRHLPPFCAVCARPLTARIPSSSGHSGAAETLRPSTLDPRPSTLRLCARCVRTPLAIDGIRAVFLFEGAVREGILRLKYHGVRSLASPLGAQVANYFLANPLPVDAVLPVPLHSKRQRERGYNQSELLAREVVRRTGLRLLENALARVKDAPSQARSASAEERRRNVRDAFQGVEEKVKGLRLVVVDDVCTTGSTLEACSLALRKAGAAAVWGLTLAREV